MYKCDDCGCVFEEPAIWEEKHGLAHGPYEKQSGCPNCSGGYTFARECEECGEIFTVEDEYLAPRLCNGCELKETGEE